MPPVPEGTILIQFSISLAVVGVGNASVGCGLKVEVASGGFVRIYKVHVGEDMGVTVKLG
jgi:hypothetical protein